ncbi:unnamed protein product [Spirodela intermedia]|uniref:ABC transporter domain-containing protein n=1 Tax=Spirodela intermedia TaxID=51605 RepID=A0A7I8JHC5_SPIIN|nr:unnamed protein product [Spirodela intermedia]CAA6669546.1 unnamed protein product [Spirodela intermedia]
MSPLSQALWKEKVETEFLATCRGSDPTTATVGVGEAKTLLSGATGYAKPRTLTAVMGPSGSGKSTLLDSLSGRLPSNAFLSGTILLNGRKTTLSFGTAGDHILHGKPPAPGENAVVGEEAPRGGTIDEMGLRDCTDTPIGNWHLRGISTGEKRRVSIAVEILTRPRLLFLDEPTSGLDSASAFFVVQTLRNLARDGRTVIASVHQPSNEVFGLFDHLCLLSAGRIVYFGQASEAYNFFTHAGFPCPPLRNPSDHFLRCINSDFDKVGATLKSERGVDPPEEVTAAEATLRLIHLYKTSPYSRATREEIEEMAKVEGLVLESMGSQASFLMQTRTLVRRSFTNMWRDFGYYRMRFIIYVIVSICMGPSTGTWERSRGACSAFVFGFVTFMSVGGFPSFVEDMKVFHRERLNGHYGVAAYAISNTLSAVPFLILISITAGTICYTMVRLHPGSATTSSSSCGIFMLVSGHYRLPNDLPKPVWKYPLSYMSFHFWALQALLRQPVAGAPRISGEYVLEKFLQVSIHRSKWIDLGVLFSMVVIYRLLFFAMIKLGEEVVPRLRRRAARKRLLRQKRKGSAAGDVALGSLDRSPS